MLERLSDLDIKSIAELIEKDTDILAKVKPTKTGNSLTSSGVRGRDVSQNDMILKAHKPGSIRSNASDTKTP